MSKTYGTMQGCKQQVTRTGCKEIWAELKTWNGSVDVTVTSDEEAIIEVNNLNVRLNGSKMYRDPDPTPKMTRVEMIKSLRQDLKYMFLDGEGEKMKDRDLLHRVMPSVNIRELGPLIILLQKFKKELDFKLNTERVNKEMKQ